MQAFRAKLAAALGVSRSTLWQWMRGGGKRRNIDKDLVELLEAERDAADERSIEIADLCKRFREAHSNV